MRTAARPTPTLTYRFPVLADRAEELGLMKLAHFLRNGILPV
jgi:hypothetical protein